MTSWDECNNPLHDSLLVIDIKFNLNGNFKLILDNKETQKHLEAIYVTI